MDGWISGSVLRWKKFGVIQEEKQLWSFVFSRVSLEKTLTPEVRAVVSSTLEPGLWGTSDSCVRYRSRQTVQQRGGRCPRSFFCSPAGEDVCKVLSHFLVWP
jgi:hypothetical protein